MQPIRHPVPFRNFHFDHTVDWQYYGPTNTGNVAPLCPPVPALKTETRFRADRNDFGALCFITPTGASADSDPPPF